MRVINAITLGIIATAQATPAPGSAHIAIKPAGNVEVTIGSGTIIGTATTVESFYGIPYADAPVGPLRLRPPRKLSRHLGQFNATSPGPICPQGPSRPALSAAEGIRSAQDSHVGQEDCLTITVQRPAGIQADSKLPVLFWIYGGAFEFGDTNFYNATDLLTTLRS